MTVLEARVDELAVKVERDREIAWTSYREAQDTRVWHKHNVELLRVLRETQVEHGATLEEHSRQLAEHGRMLGMLTVGMHDIQPMLKHLIEREGGESASPTAS